MAKKTYVAQWRVEGLRDEPLETGDTITLEQAEAEDLVAAGVLVRQESAEPALEDMSKAELVNLAKTRFSVDLDKRLTKDEMISNIRDFEGVTALEGPGVEGGDQANSTEADPTKDKE